MKKILTIIVILLSVAVQAQTTVQQDALKALALKDTAYTMTTTVAAALLTQYCKAQAEIYRNDKLARSHNAVDSTANVARQAAALAAQRQQMLTYLQNHGYNPTGTLANYKYLFDKLKEVVGTQNQIRAQEAYDAASDKLNGLLDICWQYQDVIKKMMP